MKNYNGFADEVIQSEIQEHYPHDRLIHFSDPDSGLERVKYSELCHYRGKGLPVGSSYENGELVYYLRPYEHTMLNGLSGSGKTTVFYENFILCLASFPDDRKSSMIYIDYKHDVLKKHRKYLLDHGYTVFTFDLIDPMHSHTWNPLESKVATYIAAIKAKDEKALIEVDQFIRGLGNCLCPTPPEVKDPMWSNGSRSYICALIYVLFDLAVAGVIPPEDVTFENVRNLHLFIRAFWMQKRSTFGSDVLTAKDIANIKPFALLGETFTKSDYISAFLTVLGCGSITGSSYMATIEPALSILCDQSIMRVTRSATSSESIDFEKMLEKPTFVCISPSGTPASNKLISMFFDRLFDFVRIKTAYEPLKRPLHVLLDEVCNMDCIDNLCTYISTTRSMRVYYHLGVQSDGMLSARYGEFNAISLRNNVTEFFFGSQEKSTLSRFVSQGGETTAVDLNFRLGMCDHIAFKTHSVVTSSDLSIMPLGTFYVRQARHMLLKSSMIPSFAVKEFENSEAAQAGQDEIITISRKLDFNCLENNQRYRKQDENDYNKEQETVIEGKRQPLKEQLKEMENWDDEEVEDDEQIDNNDMEQYKKALWECVKSGIVSPSFIQLRCHVDYNTAMDIMEWMEENKYITAFPDREVKLTVEQFSEKFGDPEDIVKSSEEEEQKRIVELRREALMARFRAMKEDKEDDDDEDEDDEDDDEDSDDDFYELMSNLTESIRYRFEGKNDEGKCIFAFDRETNFELSFLEDRIIISDGGSTLKMVQQSERRIRNVLKEYNSVKLENEEIFIIVEDGIGTIKSLLTLYAAIDAVKRMK